MSFAQMLSSSFSSYLNDKHRKEAEDTEEEKKSVSDERTLIDSTPPVRSVPVDIASNPLYLQTAFQSVHPGDQFNIDITDEDVPRTDGAATQKQPKEESSMEDQSAADEENTTRTRTSLRKKNKKKNRNGPVDAFASAAEEEDAPTEGFSSPISGVQEVDRSKSATDEEEEEEVGKVFEDHVVAKDDTQSATYTPPVSASTQNGKEGTVNQVDEEEELLISHFTSPSKVSKAVEIAERSLPPHIKKLLNAKMRSEKSSPDGVSDEQLFAHVVKVMFEAVPTPSQTRSLHRLPAENEKVQAEKMAQARELFGASLESYLSKNPERGESNVIDLGDGAKTDVDVIRADDDDLFASAEGRDDDDDPLSPTALDREISKLLYDEPALSKEVMDESLKASSGPEDADVDSESVLISGEEKTVELKGDDPLFFKGNHEKFEGAKNPSSLIDPSFRSLALSLIKRPQSPLSISTRFVDGFNPGNTHFSSFIRTHSHQAVVPAVSSNTAMDEDILNAEPMVLVEEDPEDLAEQKKALEAAAKAGTALPSLDFGLGAASGLEALGSVFSNAESATLPVTARSKRIKMYANWARSLQMELDSRALALFTRSKKLHALIANHLKEIDERINYVESIPFVRKTESDEAGFDEDAKALETLFNLTRPAPYEAKRKILEEIKPDEAIIHFDADHMVYDPKTVQKDQDNEEILSRNAKKGEMRIMEINGIPIAFPKNKVFTPDEQKAIERISTAADAQTSVFEKRFAFQDPTLDPLQWVQLDSYTTVDGPAAWTGSHFMKGKFGIQQTNMAAAAASGGLSSIILSRTIDLPGTGYVAADFFLGGGQTSGAVVFLATDQRNLCYVEIGRASGSGGDYTVYVRQMKRGVVIQHGMDVVYKKEVKVSAAQWFKVEVLFENRGETLSVAVSGQPVFVEAKGLIHIDAPEGQGGYIGLGSLGGMGMVTMADLVAARIGAPALTALKHLMATTPRVDVNE
eukprot:GDKJ01062771.1.p1 GENE.GDKJ01062771.1~~GDKJ01062771.1.p1  ORF type:complete len:979 (-),score=319.64 GDKJ01062771.1:130-3066(-)